MESEAKEKRRGWIFIGLWAIFITIGIIEKRMFDHADRMMMYHFPAAVFLVVGWYYLSRKIREQYKKDIRLLGRTKRATKA